MNSGKRPNILVKQSHMILPPSLGATQLEIGLERNKEADRNYHLGGRSFYFFDFDDNVAFLTTPIILFHKSTAKELKISSSEWAQQQHRIGKEGPFGDYQIRWDDFGSFKCFRDHDETELKRLGLKKQIFLADVGNALGFSDLQWKGPSWSCFYHATFNQRPISVITARGHAPETIAAGIELLVDTAHLPARPNYLSIFPVSHPPTRLSLGDLDLTQSVAELKQSAIRASVEMAIETYGYSPHHRFGMSDDDPKNIQLIFEEMVRLKNQYPEMSFFLIETQRGEFIKHEITTSGLKDTVIEPAENQIRLF